MTLGKTSIHWERLGTLGKTSIHWETLGTLGKTSIHWERLGTLGKTRFNVQTLWFQPEKHHRAVHSAVISPWR